MNKVSACTLAIFLAICGVFLIAMTAVDTSEEPKNLAGISYRDLEEMHIYHAEELVVLDCFAALEDDEVDVLDDEVDVLYMSVLFEDKDGKFAILNMPVNESDEIWDDVNDYINDDSMSYYDDGTSDLVLSGYVKTEYDVDIQHVLHDYFDEWLAYYREDIGLSVGTSDLRFDFVCGEDGDPYAIVKGSSTAGTVGGILSIVLALAVLYFGVLRKRKPAQPAYAQDPSVDEQLSRYQALVASGVMTTEEYEQKRQELLGQ